MRGSAPRPKLSDPAAPARGAGPRAAQRHTHRINVETGPEPVVLTIGQQSDPAADGAAGPGGTGHPAVPGGFAKFFNRVIDTGAWASLSEAGRAVYMPLVRFADGRDGFRVRVGVAGLMRATNLSRSSVKRGLKVLQESRLLALVRAGGVAPDGTNRTNVYQLLLPEPGGPDDRSPFAGGAPAEASPTRRTQSAARAKRGGSIAPGRLPTEPPAGSPANPLPSRPGTPPPLPHEPPDSPAMAPAGGRKANPAAGPVGGGTGSAAGPLIRQIPRTLTSEPDAGAVVEDASMLLPDEASETPPGPESADRPGRAQMQRVLLDWGIQPATASELAADHEPAEIMSAVALARKARDQGRLRNPAGFIVRCLSEAWPAPEGFEEPTCGDLAQRQAREQAQRRAEAQQAAEACAAADAVIDELDEQTLIHLAERVIAAHSARPAMLRLLRARPPRQSRLMRAEIAALLELESD